MLKTILKVKPNTLNDIIFVEINRPDIISKIKQSQKKFYKKCKTLQQDEAVVREVLDTIFGCPLYTNVCNKYDVLLLKYPSVNTILNPTTVKDADIVGSMLLEIENVRISENLQ